MTCGSINKEPSDKEVAFDYLKAPDFRVVWADGIFGTITPNGLLHIAPFAERLAIPRRQVFAIEQVDQDVGKLGAELGRVDSFDPEPCGCNA
jgi:hypothetical protein